MEQAVPELVHEAAEPAAPAARRLRDNVAPLLNAVRQRSRNTYAYADKQLHGHPWASAATLFGAGVVVGALIALAARHGPHD